MHTTAYYINTCRMQAQHPDHITPHKQVVRQTQTTSQKLSPLCLTRMDLCKLPELLARRRPNRQTTPTAPSSCWCFNRHLASTAAARSAAISSTSTSTSTSASASIAAPPPSATVSPRPCPCPLGGAPSPAAPKLRVSDPDPDPGAHPDPDPDPDPHVDPDPGGDAAPSA